MQLLISELNCLKYRFDLFTCLMEVSAYKLNDWNSFLKCDLLDQLMQFVDNVTT